MVRSALLIFTLGFVMVSTLHGGEINFTEDFALGKDRAEALKKLIPGTEDYYYFHSLYYLHTQQYDKAVAMFKPWFERFKQSPLLTEIQTRHALLTYDKNPQASLDYFKTRLGLRFDQQKIVQGGAPNLPTALDPKLIAQATLVANARIRWQQGTDNYEESAVDAALASNPDAGLRRHLLTRLNRPDVANLAKLVADDLNSEHSGGFGSIGIHRQLTMVQLEELLKLRADLIDNNNFVQAWVTRLQPNDDEDWRRDPALTKAYLDRLLAFTRKLSPVFNPLKAHVLFHRLTLDETMGTMDKALFLEYIKLPRFQNYMSRGMLENQAARKHIADLNADFMVSTLLSTVHNDELLVRSYLKTFLLNADSTRDYDPYINDTYLSHLFAEVKIENGLGEPETWANRLPPEMFRQLKERIDIDFAATNKTAFGVDEPVNLELAIKNVPNLMVKVFEINTQNFYRTQKREVDTAINLDGLVANSEKTYTYTDSPFLKKTRKFDFPQLSKPGVYVIDFIGNGKSSRALVRKGRLRAIPAMGTAGQRLTILDEAGKRVPAATVWMGGQEFKANAEGVVLIPFSTAPAHQPIVISKGDFSSIDRFDHQAEKYTLNAGIYVDRESLLSQRVASVVVRPGLRINGLPVSIKLLEEVKLVIIATDSDGIATTAQIEDFRLFEDRESVHEFRVPTRLAKLEISLRAKVKSLSLGKEIDLGDGQSFTVNGIVKTDKIEDLHFAKFGDDFFIELLGRTGEAKAERPVLVSLKHRDFREKIDVMLKSDPQGRVKLGPLADIVTVFATGPEGTAHQWNLPLNRHTYQGVVHAQLGSVIALPYLGSETKPNRAELSLFEMRGKTILADRFTALAIQDGMIEITGLKPGDYDLLLKTTGELIRVRVVDGSVEAGYVVGKTRLLQLPILKPVQITSVTTDAENVVIRLRDFSSFTRLHVYGTRYLPAYSGYNDLAKVRGPGLEGQFPTTAESIYLAGRNIGDEYRYIVDRRNQKKLPGNMLERPALLLNPWVLRSTETGEQLAQAGEDYQKRIKETVGGAIPPVNSPLPSEPKSESGAAVGEFADLNFLLDPTATLLNLVPDKDGIIKIKRKDLGSHAMIHMLAIDPVNTTTRSISLPESKSQFVDLRLRNGLEPKSHFTQQRQVQVLPAGKPFVIADASASKLEVYDSLAKVYNLYSTLSHDPKLAEFSFVLSWPKLKFEEKTIFYSKFACHELNFFLAKKDPEFFKAVVKPYLVNKKDKTFVDHWLLENDLSYYLQPWQYSRLNTFERVLLSQRIAGEPTKTTRHLTDLVRLLPPNPERERMLYETALKSSNLETDVSTFGLATKQLDELRLLEKKTNGQAWGYLAGKSDPGKPAAMPAGGAKGPGAPQLEEQLRRREGRSGVEKDGESKQPDPKNDNDDLFYADERKEQAAPSRLYRRLDVTQELAENNYYKLPIEQQIASLIGVNEFWLDYSKHDGKSPFLSRNLAESSRNFSEMMMALAVLDLPFTPAKHESQFANGQMTFTPGSTVLIFHEEVKQVAGISDKVQILVSQNFYRVGDRYRDENGERFDKFITQEFVIQTVYGCQVVVTNPTPSKQRLSVLIQIPVGAVAVANGQSTKTVPVELEPYRTQIIDFQFYFPAPGKFIEFPVHVAKAESLVAAAAPFVFNVVAQPTKLDTESWEYVSQNGTDAQVLAMMERENVCVLDLAKIAFRMRDKAFFEQAMNLLKDRHMFNQTLASYSLFHNSVPLIRDYFAHTDSIIVECGGPIVSPLLVIDAVARNQYQHLEYKPLINARAHSLGKTRQIVNGRLHTQYHSFLKQMCYMPKLNDADQLAATYYFLVQDRVEEAMASFAQVKPENVPTRMQYDYCAAYLDLFNDEPKKARSLIATYSNHPVERWRNAFAAIGSQLDEYEGKAPKLVDKDDPAQQQAKLAAKEASFEFGVAAKTINLTWKNVETVRVNYYLMDVELLFSRNPFVQQSGGQFSMIRPNETAEIKLPLNQSKLAIPLPDNLADKNVLVEITANGKTRSVPVLANVMTVTLNENYGQLQVTETGSGKSLSKVYIKTYCRLADGTVKFHKDGYTDRRGKFDYASVSTPEKSGIVKFGILILSDSQGAVIREVAPPQQ